jgi:hypothetical protein
VKDHGDLRRDGGQRGLSRRIRNHYQSELSELWSETFGAVCKPDDRIGKTSPMRRPLTNWIVKRDGDRVIAVEPSREYENVFDGGDDPFSAALDFAAAQLRKELDDA